MLALCPYCAQHRADSCISVVQRLAFEMCLFQSADFRMSPSEIGIKLNILLANLTCQNLGLNLNLGPVSSLPGAHQRKWDFESHSLGVTVAAQHQKALASRMGTLGTHITIRIHLAADSECLGAASRVSMSHSSHIPRDNIPKIAWEVFKYYIIS